MRQAWALVEEVVDHNTQRVVEAFRRSNMSEQDLKGSIGYGYQDPGRMRLDAIVAQVFGTEAAAIRPQWASGTHAITTALKALTPPARHIWLANGAVYDTLWPVLEWLRQSRHVDVSGWTTSQAAVLQPGDVVYIQRSRGYQLRRAWGKPDMVPIIELAHQRQAVVVVDNCYGEFTQPDEPGHWGADLVVGSLMKNPGGSVAPTGAYVAGRQSLVERVLDELYAPGLGGEVGATGPFLRPFAQGLYLAPLLVGEALAGGLYLSYQAAQRGYRVDPAPDQVDRNDIVVAVELGRAERVMRFCQAIQSWSPIDAAVTLEAWAMPGYAHPIVMAAGGFVPGGSLELSADAPIRPPYVVYVQGGVNRWHTVRAVDHALAAVAPPDD